jgi:hypothetical protein
VEGARQEARGPLLAELLAVGRIAQELGARLEIGEVQRVGAGAELLEDHQVHAVGPEIEDLGEGLQAEVGAEEAVAEAGDGPDDAPDAAVGADVHERDDRGAQPLAADAHALEEEEQGVDLGGHVGDALEDAAAIAQVARQAAVLRPAGEGRWQRPAAELAAAAHLVPLERHHRQAEVALVEPLVEDALHPAQLVLARAQAALEAAAEPHDMGADRRVAEERGDVGAERQLAQVLQVLADGLPALASIEQRAHDLVGDGLDAAEHVGQVLGCAQRQAQTAAPHHHGRDPMPQRLGERRRQLHLGVVVRVKVDEPRHHPLAGGIDDRGGLQPVIDGHHLPTLDPHIGDPSGRPPPVEDRAATNDNVHHRRRLARNPHAR